MTQDQFETELDRVMNQAFGYSVRLSGGDQDEGADLLQEAALLAFRGRENFEIGTNFKAWFFRIITNQFYRRGTRVKVMTVPLDDNPEPFLFSHALGQGISMESDPDEVLLSQLSEAEVRKAIDELPDEFRAAAAMSFLADFSYDEIASALNVPVGTVRSRLHRGRRLLQARLWDLAVEHGLVGGERVV